MCNYRELSGIEHRLLRAVCAGAGNKAIAQQLGKSEFTVRNQLSNLFKKINICNRTQAAGWYREQTLLQQLPQQPPAQPSQGRQAAQHQSVAAARVSGNGTSVPLRTLPNIGNIHDQTIHHFDQS